MLKIFCDETWTSHTEFSNVRTPYFVFYGVLIEDDFETGVLQKIADFKTRRGLFSPDKKLPTEIKWQKVEEEWRGAKKRGQPSRYEEFLDIFFDELKIKRLSVGYMFLDKREYNRVEQDFVEKGSSRHDFFFMLYFQFLYHCFIKRQIKHQPCQIYIDYHDMGAEGNRYDINTLREILNRKLFRDLSPKHQLSLPIDVNRKLVDSIQLVSLADSKESPLIQMSDLCAGCVRYVIENQVEPPNMSHQFSLFDEEKQEEEFYSGKDSLTNYFYRKLRAVKGYNDINLLKISYHYRFNIFPFEFKT